MAENVVIDGNALLCTPGGSKGRIVALDKKTGTCIWANTEIADRAAYCSPAVATHNGTRQLITLMQKGIVSVDVSNGKLLWTHRHQAPYGQNVTMPIYRDGYVYASSGHKTGARLVKIGEDGKSVSEVWAGEEQDNCHGGVVLRDGCLFGSGCRLYGRGLVCVDFLTGRMLWNDKSIGKVSITYADGMLYCLSDKGRMSLVDANRGGCRVVSQFDIPKGSQELPLSHPVVCWGRLYVRHWDNLLAYDVSATPSR